MTPPDLAAGILAGGRARRFHGRDKGRLLVDGRPIIVRQRDVLQRLTPRVFVVSPDHRRFADLGLPVYADRRHDAGTLGAIHTAISVAGADRVLIVAADQPFLTAALLERLAVLAAEGDGAWVETARGVEPLVACYRRRALPALIGALAEGDLKAANLGRRLRMVALAGDDLARLGDVRRLLVNVNTPADYSTLE